jgi:acetolactate synthase-1/3 small subunit
MLTFSVYVQDAPGALNRVASLFRRRAFNIASLTVGHTEQAGLSRMTIVVDAAEAAASRIEAHLLKILDVERVEVIHGDTSVDRELAMIKVSAPSAVRGEIMQIADVFRARIIDVAPESLIVEISGAEDKIDGLLEVLRPYGVIEMVRTGRLAMSRGASPVRRRKEREIEAQESAGISYSV